MNSHPTSRPSERTNNHAIYAFALDAGQVIGEFSDPIDCARWIAGFIMSSDTERGRYLRMSAIDAAIRLCEEDKRRRNIEVGETPPATPLKDRAEQALAFLQEGERG